MVRPSRSPPTRRTTLTPTLPHTNACSFAARARGCFDLVFPRPSTMSSHASLLEEFVVDEERAVSFAWLARELGVSADAAKA